MLILCLFLITSISAYAYSGDEFCGDSCPLRQIIYKHFNKSKKKIRNHEKGSLLILYCKGKIIC